MKKLIFKTIYAWILVLFSITAYIYLAIINWKIAVILFVINWGIGVAFMFLAFANILQAKVEYFKSNHNIPKSTQNIITLYYNGVKVKEMNGVEYWDRLTK